MRRLLLAFLLVGVSQFALAQKADSPRAFEYDSKASFETEDIGADFRGDIAIYDLSYANTKGGRVTASLVLPPGKGPFAAIIWGHWCWANSDFHNRKEFLSEAVALAPSGVASLLVDFPIARPGYVVDQDPLSEKHIDELVEQVVAIRRSADLLLSRPFVDQKRLAYVGHSCGASAGAVVSGVDKRFRAFVFMASPISDEAAVKTPQFQEFRQKAGPQKVDAFLAKYSWTDQGKYIAHAAPASLFFQYASKEDFLSPDLAEATAALASQPKQIKIYDAPHALNAEARRDRIAFLAEQLQFKSPSAEAIAAVPDLPQPPEPKP
jgi:cephalosporin-C deacetylase-like acetyl esterase